jgi:hypothetical protein
MDDHQIIGLVGKDQPHPPKYLETKKKIEVVEMASANGDS